MPPIVSAKR
jgi:predicted nuclease of predicted toxin-antitoxin system